MQVFENLNELMSSITMLPFLDFLKKKNIV